MADDVTNDRMETEEKASGIGSALAKLGVGAWVGIAVATLVVGLLIGHFALGSGSGSALNKASLTEGELDTAVASFSYNGSSSNITAREVLEQNGSLESSQDEDGNYSVPSADTVLSYARNKIIENEADNRGITISDEDLDAYAEEMLGTSDYESIASTYGMDEDNVKTVLMSSAKMNKLREEVLGDDADAGTMPEAPEAPEVESTTDETAEDANAEDQTDEDAEAAAQEAAYDEPKKEYAEYIIALAGDEWDADKGAFKDEDGTYATALADYEVTKDGASYNAAQAAYYVAYQEYSTKQTEISQKWTDYVNELLGNATIQIYSLKS